MLDEKEIAALMNADPFKSAAKFQRAQLAIQYGIYQELKKLNEILASGKPEAGEKSLDIPEKPKRKK